MSPSVELTGVTKSYGPPGEDQTPVLRGVDFKVAPGESVAIIGPSGCGKSTLLNIIGTLDRPTSGRVLLDGTDVTELSEKDLAPLRSASVGFIFQLHHLLPQCSLLENALVPSLVARDSAGAEERARKLLDRVGLSARLTHRPGQLSGGECQRAAVVRALVNRPKILLADEPTGSLDRQGAESLAQLLFELNREEGVSLVLVTHAQDLAGRAGRVVELRDGLLQAR
ncbi:MAG TPA: ABC transporter ATP-binding protein [Planctomycetota bacterium]|nr:ABC transporter ATP-binding protein [Planctomycetota bacterium]